MKLKDLGKKNAGSIHGGFQKIEKGITFVKTEKQVYDAMSANIKKIEENCAYVEGTMKVLVDSIGSEPDAERETYLDFNNGDPDYKYKEYEIDYGSTESKPMELSNLSINKPINKQKLSVSQLKSKYNNMAYRYLSLMRQKKRLEKLKDNLDSKSGRKHTFSEYELDQYGF